jgi:hypothetical protein
VRLAGWAIAATVAFAACNDTNVHIFSARPFDQTRMCVDAPVSIDVINGGSTSSNCSPECLTATVEGGPPVVFVSTQCPPFPEGYTTEAESEGTAGDACHQAFKAFAGFEADGGLCPPIADAGADAAPDAVADAVADAPAD